ncbi:uncharacterized protein LOC126232562 [Schistocerca nitens]|uniref:uncharacterized protein LOC126232562 n=1 Tax=Schistocerca nitens TaxID=7011 RepID=UPI0021177F0A|nr:uncharacterized protein LOC126232562 [Schistocerca nitens]
MIPLTALLNECLKRGIVPDQWKYSKVIILYMGKGNTADPNAYRGTALENTLFKIFTTLLCKRLRDILDEKLPDSQFGFRCGRSVAQAVQSPNRYKNGRSEPKGKASCNFRRLYQGTVETITGTMRHFPCMEAHG